MSPPSPARERRPPPGFASFARFLAERSGVELGADKAYLVETRLAPVWAARGLPDLQALVDTLECTREPALERAVIEAMLIHETQWFRDEHPFEILTHALLPPLFAEARPVRIWSAACATGQEAYSVLIAASEAPMEPGRPPPRVELVATDLSRPALERAARGVFDAESGLRGLSPARCARHFERIPEGYRVLPALREQAVWRQHNLLDDPAALGIFDVVFLRNVLIYFSPATRLEVLERVAGRLRPGGHLFLGASESLPPGRHGLRPVRHGTGVAYRRLPAG